MQMNPNARISQLPRDREGILHNNVQPFGFWLPHGLLPEEDTLGVQIQDHKERFNKTECAYRHVESLPIDKLWLQSEQAEFLEQHPALVPGGQNDYPEVDVELHNKATKHTILPSHHSIH